jgi:hypothetical protein
MCNAEDTDLISVNLRSLWLAILVFTLVNFTFVALNYVADTVPPEWVKHRIVQAIKRHNVTTDRYPLFRYGLPSIYSLIGIDQITDCMTYLHALHRDPDPIKNAIVPGYVDIKGRDHTNLCAVVKRIAFGEAPEETLVVKRKIRLWHGAKTALLLALPKLNFFQINVLLKQVSYVAYCLLAFVLFYRSKKTGLMFAPIALAGIFASGVTVLGGITHALPYLTALITGIGLVSIRPGIGGRASYLWSTAMGSVLAFFYQVDGSVILGVGLVVLCAYFHTFAHSIPRTRWLHTTLLPAVFVSSVFFSLVFKQLIGFIYFDPDWVWDSFIAEIGYRMQGEHQGRSISPLTALQTQFKSYYFAVLNWHDAADFLKFTGTWGWLLAALLAVWLALRDRRAAPLSDLLAFGIIGAVAVARYLLMANHSQIHTLFVSRYLFLTLSVAWSACIWFSWSAAEKVRGADHA